MRPPLLLRRLPALHPLLTDPLRVLRVGALEEARMPIAVERQVLPPDELERALDAAQMTKGGFLGSTSG